ncbi:NAD regulator [Hoeflea sp. EC-HK425]|uniref:NUDIX hydrolase n=1 Tax=Hoeflea sp. EC-HK425 TaxID=2038388 RepID=UPI0012577AC9|nr:NAD regulator [Hoeflea sp. EC-HK425]VVT08559.1 NAD regulator [Hoeflea sp. EC-HK425]|tara:strand:- start:559 stop:1545 length:987 start_codon:yes stop_codon:yes gene_type:complete
MQADRIPPLRIGLNAAIVAVTNRTPSILTVPATPGDGPADGLPFGPFDPVRHRTFEASLRGSVESQTALNLGYVEQLYTFGDRGRQMDFDEARDGSPHLVSVGYLALTRADAENPEALHATGARWRDWYELFPWEDWREGRPSMLDASILPRLKPWAEQPAERPQNPSRKARIRLAFGLGDFPWDEERVLDRYELLYEAGLLAEAVADQRVKSTGLASALGRAMRFDHRRIAATAVQRLRAKIKYRPVIFELMPPEFTLTELQTTVEAISGRHLHKQNFRRLVEGAELVEPTGASSSATGGRPAALYRFRAKILEERPAPGLRLGGRG